MAACARIIWRAGVDRAALSAVAAPSADAAAFDLRRVSASAVIAVVGGQEQLALATRRGPVRLDIIEGTLLEGPVKLECRLVGLDHLEARLRTLRRFAALTRGGVDAGAPHPDRSAARWLAMLRAHDAHCAGASLREIVGLLFGEEAITGDWRAEAEDLRSRVRRMLGRAHELIDGGYRQLL